MRLELSNSVIRSFEMTDAPIIAKHGMLKRIFPDPFSVEATKAFLREIVGAVPEQWFVIEVGRRVVGIEVYRRLVGAFHVRIPPRPEQDPAASVTGLPKRNMDEASSGRRYPPWVSIYP